MEVAEYVLLDTVCLHFPILSQEACVFVLEQVR